MEKYRALIEKMKNQEVYFVNELENVVYKSTPNGDFFGKVKGGKEFKADYTSPIFNDALVEGNEVTKEVYEKY